MKRVLTLLMLFALVPLMAIDCLPGSGRSIEQNTRDYHLAYHNHMDDYHFYGSNSWAVRFDFANYYYPNLQDLSFTINSLRLWFPQTGDSVRVRLLSDEEGLPALPEIASYSVLVDTNDLTIPLSEPITLQCMWMIVDYNTFFNGPYVSASSGDGSHSYYLNTSMETPFFQNLAHAGYNAELLFGVVGEFAMVSDLRLVSLDLVGEYGPDKTVYPSFVIHNHSEQPVSGLSINLNLTFPQAEDNISQTINIGQSIPPQADFVWDEQQPGYSDYGITIPRDPMQARFRGTIIPPADTDNYAPNNTIDKYYYSFIEEMPVHMVENFFRSSNAASILHQEAAAIADGHLEDVHLLNYLPVLADTLSSTAALNHFSWYGFNTLPRVVLGGEGRIIGLRHDFRDNFAAKCDSLTLKRSFISSSRLDVETEAETMTLGFGLVNDNTQFFSGGGNYDLVRNSVFFAGLFKEVNLSGQQFWNLEKWVVRAQPFEDGINMGDRQDIIAEMSTLGLDPRDNFRLYYWIQERRGGSIYYANMTDLEIPGSNDDYVQAPATLSLSPNPLKGNRALKVDIGTDSGILKIYNIRGQLIHSQTISSQKAQLDAGIFPQSGVYLVSIQSLQDKTRKHTAKISIIK
ncbi:MAG TPA: hypothetical protein DCQ12_04435 [Candidatus Cloacimonas sp.]|nr:hypothetical protein [Candidatus Cloacimonas sp.]